MALFLFIKYMAAIVTFPHAHHALLNGTLDLRVLAPKPVPTLMHAFVHTRMHAEISGIKVMVTQAKEKMLWQTYD